MSVRPRPTSSDKSQEDEGPPRKKSKLEEKIENGEALTEIEAAKLRIAKLRTQIKQSEQKKDEFYTVSGLMDKVIDNIEDSLKAVKRMKASKEIAVDAEWSGESPNEKLCLIQVSFYTDEGQYQEDKKPQFKSVFDELVQQKEIEQFELEFGSRTSGQSHTKSISKFKRSIGVYLFDVLVGGKEMLEKGGLKSLLESTQVIKVFHDCRHDSYILSRYGVTMRNVMDTQIMHYLLSVQQTNHHPLPTSLNHLLKTYGYDDLEEKDDSRNNKVKEEAKKAMAENPEFWTIRPFSEMMLQYARLDVLYLLNAYKRICSFLIYENQEKALKFSNAYLNQIRNQKSKKVELDGADKGNDHVNNHPNSSKGERPIPKYGIEMWDNLAKAKFDAMMARRRANFEPPPISSVEVPSDSTRQNQSSSSFSSELSSTAPNQAVSETQNEQTSEKPQ